MGFVRVIDLGDPRLIATSPTTAATVTGPPKCWGIVSATEGDTTSGKMAKIIHSSAIADLIMRFEDQIGDPVSPAPTLPPNLPATNKPQAQSPPSR
jgi:hypothetical protein